MSSLAIFGLFAVTAMLVCYALERHSRWFIFAFAGACALGAAYGFLQGAWPFGLVEAVWSVVAVRKWWLAGRASIKNKQAVTMHVKSHWESVYKNKEPDGVSWFQPHLNKSLDLILKSGIGTEAQIIDVGGGASTLVDDLLKKHFKNITVVDVSAEALNKSKQRLRNLEGEVTWIEADVTRVELPGTYYDLWHDRALFHFFTDQKNRQAYIKSLLHSLTPGGHLVISTFSLKGPAQCSGLDCISSDLFGHDLGI